MDRSSPSLPRPDYAPKVKPAIGKFVLAVRPTGQIEIDLPREDCLKVLAAVADYEVENCLCG